MRKKASPELEAFIDEGLLETCKKHNYTPTAFIAMRNRLGTLGAIEQLVLSGDIQSGFKRLQSIRLLEWSIEAAVTSFQMSFLTMPGRAPSGD